jgi:protein TonB
MVRLVIAIVLGAAVTFGLFFLMQALVASGQSAITKAEKVRVVDFVRVQREETTEYKRSKPQRPPNPDEAPPDAPQPSVADSVDAGATQAIAVSEADTTLADTGALDLDIGNVGFGVAPGSADGDYVPLVRVAPVYPRRAEERGIEGWVILELTVTETGAVKNPRVIECYPSDIFNKAALEAALKFKYKPRVVNGKPIAVRGVRYKLTFEMAN